MSMPTRFFTSLILLLIALATAFFTGNHFMSLYEREPVVKGPGVTRVGKLSDYFSKIKDTVADTNVYFLEGSAPGATVVVFGGIHCIIANERAAEIAAMAVMDLGMQGIKMRLEPSPKKLRGMTHRELGDHTQTLALLMETPSPAMDKLHGRVDASLILTGKDEFFRMADNRRLLYAAYGQNGYPLDERVGRHLASVAVLIQLLAEVHPDQKVEAEKIPEYKALQEKGIGSYLRPPKE